MGKSTITVGDLKKSIKQSRKAIKRAEKKYAQLERLSKKAADLLAKRRNAEKLTKALQEMLFKHGISVVAGAASNPEKLNEIHWDSWGEEDEYERVRKLMFQEGIDTWQRQGDIITD